MTTRQSREIWRTTSMVQTMVGVGLSVLLISISAGVQRVIRQQVHVAGLGSFPINAALIDGILSDLTVLVVAAMLLQVAIGALILGITMMRSKRVEIAIRRQSGVTRARLLREFLLLTIEPVLVGGLVGEVLGILSAFVMEHTTVLPVHFGAAAIFAAFPTCVVLSVVAVSFPAWSSANTSPATLRKGLA